MNDQLKRLLRSWMFVPGDKQKMIDKALALPNDAIILDLEDGVAFSEKQTARRQIGAFLAGTAERLKKDPQHRTPARYVRTNQVGSDRMFEDLAAVVHPGLEGLVVPKVDTPEQVHAIEHDLCRVEHEHDIFGGPTKLLIAIESPIGLFNAYKIATASPRIIGIQFGAEDFSRAMNLPLRREGEAADLLYARSAIATAAAAAHVQAVDGIWADFSDTEGLRRFARSARRLGMTGISLIHPNQIEEANAAFTPAKEDIAYASEVLQAFEAARAAGLGATAFRGQMLDHPVVDRARQTVELAKSLGVA
jgi:citrate lyase subunit beta / citryl-CoA lyase